MNLTKDQEAAVKMVKALLAEAEAGVALLRGYAGTGKTTLLRVIAEFAGTPIILTPTGKAALRVTEATGLPASTIHRWLYRPFENPTTGAVEFSRKSHTEVDASSRLVVVDEASMLSNEMYNDLFAVCQARGLSLLLVGDPFQLPPVVKEGEAEPVIERPFDRRVDLTEVVRQALDNPILRASMLIRESEMGIMDLGELAEMVPPSQFSARAAAVHKAGGVAIVHRNETRQRVNSDVRALLGRREGDLEAGEPLLVLYNNYQADKFNGEVARFDGWLSTGKATSEVFDRYSEKTATMSFAPAAVEEARVTLSFEEIFAVGQEMPLRLVCGVGSRLAQREFGGLGVRTHLNANLGYALTAHKAQGSEWDDVLVLVEQSARPYSYQGRRWLYTAITRARRKLAVCME